MDLILILAIGAIVASTGIINPVSEDIKAVEKKNSTEITTPVVQESKPEPEPELTPEPVVKEPELEPAVAKEPELTPAPEQETQQEEPI